MDYPFIKCLHPIKAYNRYAGETLLVPCGHCKACIHNKAKSRSVLCMIQEQLFSYTMFVTLTYSDDYLPTFTVLPDDKAFSFILQNNCKRFSKYFRENHFNFLRAHLSDKYTSEFLNSLDSKCLNRGSWTFGYGNKIDIQLFLKRFRKYLTSHGCKESIKYYCVLEYGPVHFRPHYHILFYFDSKSIFSLFQEALYSSWTYGRIDSSLSRGQSGGYCASYVNSSSHLPEIFKNEFAQPFCIHSSAFAKKAVAYLKKEVWKSSVRSIVNERIKIGDKFIPFYFLSSFKDAVFPKCRGFAYKSFGELCASYYLYRFAVSRYGKKIVSELALYLYRDSDLHIPKCFVPDPNDPDNMVEYPTVESIESDLYISKRFLDNIQGNDFYQCVMLLIMFYKRIAYEQLKSDYKLQEKMLESDIQNLYVDTYDFDSFSKSNLYNQFVIDTDVNFNDSIKHKTLNDLNNIFL